MRHRSFLALICHALLLATGAGASVAHVAELLSVLPLDPGGPAGGGFSGIEITPDGTGFFIVSDTGYLLHGTLERDADATVAATFRGSEPLKNGFGEHYLFPHSNAEGIALDTSGRLNISFEQVHRVMRYDTPGSPGVWPGYLNRWRDLPANEGMEAIAVDPAGVLYALTETITPAGALVFRRAPGRDWEQPFTLPLSDGYLVTGADFGPDGYLYVLERLALPPVFLSRVRRMRVTPQGLTEIRIVLQSLPGQHGNLEGLAVWRDPAGDIRLTMVSDDNIMALLRSELVEYRLKE